MSSGPNVESRKRSKDTEAFRTKLGIQMIADRFEDGRHKSVMDIFSGQQIMILFGDAVT